MSLSVQCRSKFKSPIGMDIPEFIEALDDPPNLAEQEHGNLFLFTASRR